MQKVILEVDIDNEIKKISFCDLIKIKISDYYKKWK